MASYTVKFELGNWWMEFGAMRILFWWVKKSRGHLHLIWHLKLFAFVLTASLLGQPPAFHSGTTEVRFPYAVPEGVPCPPARSLGLEVDGKAIPILDSFSIEDGPVAVGIMLNASYIGVSEREQMVIQAFDLGSKVLVSGDTCFVWNAAREDRLLHQRYSHSKFESGRNDCLRFLRDFYDLVINHPLYNNEVTGIFGQIWNKSVDAVRKLDKLDAPRKILIIFTNGIDQDSERSPADVVRANKLGGVRILFVYIDDSPFPPFAESASRGKAEIDKAIRKGGGLLISGNHPMPELTKQIKEARKQCALTFAPISTDTSGVSRIKIRSVEGIRLMYSARLVSGGEEH